MDKRSDDRAGLVRLGDVLVPAGVHVSSMGVDDDPRAPLITADYEIRDGRPECVHLELTARPDGRGIRLRDLELFTLDAATEAAFAGFAIRPDQDWRTAPTVQPEVRREAAGAVRQARRAAPGRRSELERVAEVYREHLDGKPTDAVRLVLGYGSHRTAARRVAQAREAGLLPATTAGKRKA